MPDLRPNTSWRFRRHPWSYGHGLILDFSNISMVVQFFATMRPCRPRKPSLRITMRWASGTVTFWVHIFTERRQVPLLRQHSRRSKLAQQYSEALSRTG